MRQVKAPFSKIEGLGYTDSIAMRETDSQHVVCGESLAGGASWRADGWSRNSHSDIPGVDAVDRIRVLGLVCPHAWEFAAVTICPVHITNLWQRHEQGTATYLPRYLPGTRSLHKLTAYELECI